MKKQLQQKVFETVTQVYPDAKIKLEDIEINYPPEKFGDYSCNIAMKLAGILKQNPAAIAEEIKRELEDQKNTKTEVAELSKIEVQKPGFLNFYLTAETLKDNLKIVTKEADRYGNGGIGEGKKAMVEFGQPNTHKSVTVGHLKSAISGLSVARLHKALGYDVVAANYYGDVGMHVAKSTWGVLQKGLPKDFGSWEPHKRMDWIDKRYVEAANAFKDSKEAEAEIRQINKDVYAQKDNENYKVYDQIRKWSVEHQDDFFDRLGIKYDRQYPESEIYQDALDIVEKFKGKVFEQSKGAWIYDGQKEGITTWVYLTSEGNVTYSSKDMALGVKKFKEYPDLELSLVHTSVEQSDYFKAMIVCLEKVAPQTKGKYRHVPFGWLLMDNKKTSSRMGKTIKAVDILDEVKKLAQEKISVDKDYSQKEKEEIMEKVGLAGLKFLILSHEFHKNINYDPEKFMKLNGFCGPFILYSYVRTQAILRKVKVEEKEVDLEKTLNSPEEKKLMQKILIFPEVVERAALEIAPHLICNYVYELAQDFNLFYEKHSVQNADTGEEKQSRVLLTGATGQTLKNGLNLLGIDALERM